MSLQIAFAGDRDIAVWVMDFLLSEGVRPLALLIPDRLKASHAQELCTRCSYLPPQNIIVGAQFREPCSIKRLRALDLDYILGVHFPYLIPEHLLNVSRHGFLNLHPAYLPFNRGWHTPTWAILEGTPAGATLHFMDTGLDTGDIIQQQRLPISSGDTADTLYTKLKRLELEVFKEAWPRLLSGQVTRIRQDQNAGTFHKRQDLFQQRIQKIDLDEPTTPRDLITRLRALSTSRNDEAAYFEVDGERHRVQVLISRVDEKNEHAN
jgi:methionyl-tRNA formyltransferase